MSSSFPDRWAPPIDSPHQPSFGPGDHGNSFTRASRYSSTCSLSTLTLPLVQCCRFPAGRALPSWRRHCGEPPSTLLPPMGSPWSRLPPRHHLLRWVTAGRPKSAGGATLAKGGGGLNPLFWSAGPKGSSGPDHFCWGGRVHCEPSPVVECCLLFFHPIYSNKFNSNSNLVWTLDIRRSLTKFNKKYNFNSIIWIQT
jgi:hypothetical protein